MGKPWQKRQTMEEVLVEATGHRVRALCVRLGHWNLYHLPYVAIEGF